MAVAAENFGIGIQETTTTADPGAAGTTLATTAAMGAAFTGQQLRILVQNSLSDPTNRELMLATAGLGSTSLTVTRGVEGTTAVAHAVGSYVAVVDTPEARRRFLSNQLIMPRHAGLLGWTFPGYTAESGNAQAPTAGVVILGRIPIAEKMTINNVQFYQRGAGVTLTNAFVGVYDKTRTLVGSSADQSATWTGATTYRTTTLSTPPVIDPAGDSDYWIWAAVLIGSAATMPTLERAGAIALVNHGLAGASPPLFATTGSALTALPASFTTGATAVNNMAYFLGVG